MYETDATEALKRLTDKEYADLDPIAKFEMMLLCKSTEIEGLESALTEKRNMYFLQVEQEHNAAPKSKELANAELREIEVQARVKKDKACADTIARLRRLRFDRTVMQLTIDSEKRKHELKVNKV